MQCNNLKCKNTIYLESLCKICFLNFCCKNCLFFHEFEVHKNENLTPLKSSKSISKQRIILTENSNVASTSTVKGIYSSFFKYNSKYDLKNFETEGSSNFLTFSGFYEEDKLWGKTKNLIDDKFYYIKEVRTYLITF